LIEARAALQRRVVTPRKNRRSFGDGRVVARGRRVLLRYPTWADGAEFLTLRERSRAFLEPWEPEHGRLGFATPALFERYMRFGPRHRRVRWLVCSVRGGALRGSISIGEVERGGSSRAVLGYWIGAPFARRGYMGEALVLALGCVAQELRVKRLAAYVLPENTPSKRLLAKLGFERAGIARSYRVLHGKARDHERWVIDVGAAPRVHRPQSRK